MSDSKDNISAGGRDLDYHGTVAHDDDKIPAQEMRTQLIVATDDYNPNVPSFNSDDSDNEELIGDDVVDPCSELERSIGHYLDGSTAKKLPSHMHQHLLLFLRDSTIEKCFLEHPKTSYIMLKANIEEYTDFSYYESTVCLAYARELNQSSTSDPILFKLSLFYRNIIIDQELLLFFSDLHS